VEGWAGGGEEEEEEEGLVKRKSASELVKLANATTSKTFLLTNNLGMLTDQYALPRCLVNLVF